MSILLLLALVSALAIAITIHDVLVDRDGRHRPPASHFEDPTFRSPAARS